MSEHLYTCLACPRGCRICLELDLDGGLGSIKGNRCPKGEVWARQELRKPMRTLCTTVATIFPDLPRLAVRSSTDIPLEAFSDAMELVHGICLDRRLEPGDVVYPNMYRDSDCSADLVASGNMNIDGLCRALEAGGK